MNDYEVQDCKKRKFLDSLFDSSLDSTCVSFESNKSIDTFESSQGDSKINSYSKGSKNSTTHSSNKLPELPIDKIFGLKTWIGTLLSFFLLTYIFSFKLLIVIPLLFTGLIIYLVMTLGHKYLINCMKKTRKYIKWRLNKSNSKENSTSDEGRDYKLIEI
jgi:hypothetical protein